MFSKQQVNVVEHSVKSHSANNPRQASSSQSRPLRFPLVVYNHFTKISGLKFAVHTYILDRRLSGVSHGANGQISQSICRLGQHLGQALQVLGLHRLPLRNRKTRKADRYKCMCYSHLCSATSTGCSQGWL